MYLAQLMKELIVQAVVVARVRRPHFSNISSETARSIKAKFHMES